MSLQGCQINIQKVEYHLAEQVWHAFHMPLNALNAHVQGLEI